MTVYVLDTNIISLLLRQNTAILMNFRQILSADHIVLACPMVWYELRRGLLAQDAKGQMQRLEALFATFEWQDYIRDDWSMAASLWTQRRQLGLPISYADLLIAVFARNRNAILITDNEKAFAQLGVTVENWKK